MSFFFITGLPRSRTGWLANYFSYGNTACLHDLAHDMTLKQIADMMRDLQRDYENVGYSDPVLLPWWRKANELVPDAKWLVVDRPKEDVKPAWDLAMGVDTREALAVLERQMHDLLMSKRVMLYKFDEIDQEGVLDSVAATLAPGFESPPWRNRMLRRFNVQIPVVHIAAALEERTKTWA